MARAAAGPEIERLIQLLARLPGLGPRSARRAALHLVKKKEQLLHFQVGKFISKNYQIILIELMQRIAIRISCNAQLNYLVQI